MNLRPHLVRYWLHSSEKSESPESFTEKTNEICAAYHGAEEFSQVGGHTVSVDEMTGIQALEHRYPDKPPMPGKPALMEFEYIRHGTTTLIGFFDVATGKAIGGYTFSQNEVTIYGDSESLSTIDSLDVNVDVSNLTSDTSFKAEIKKSA